MKDTLILAIESSCDETAVAIIKNGKDIVSNIVATQIDVHKEFGGVIPEVASRIHVENISMVIKRALDEAKMSVADVDAIAFTRGPGLIGSLHVGVQAAKTLAWAYNKPLVPVHHIAGHIFANNLVEDIVFPLLAIVVSGGHTELVYMKDEISYEVLGTTQDDAIGEAFDKVGRVLGLPYPGGVYIDKIAKDGQNIYKLPHPKAEKELDFSFSGLKSGVLQFINRMERNNETFKPEDLACSFQETAISVLLERANKAIKQCKPKMVVLAGGVAANSCLRREVSELMSKEYPQVKLIIPPLKCCTDNAAMIGVAGYVAYKHGVRGEFSVSAKPSIELETIKE
ncbi:MAG: tRNA (adenosine(37)-N6)-threonylcarbamoyltransferase complex transferase subunit TsaD [Erysipelotrichaceae bacterium]